MQKIYIDVIMAVSEAIVVVKRWWSIKRVLFLTAEISYPYPVDIPVRIRGGKREQRDSSTLERGDAEDEDLPAS